MKFTRRQAIGTGAVKVGAIGASLSLADYFRAQGAEGNEDIGRSAVLVFLGGGPAHQDTFDLTPTASRSKS